MRNARLERTHGVHTQPYLNAAQLSGAILELDLRSQRHSQICELSIRFSM
jgi:hypothetical protein